MLARAGTGKFKAKDLVEFLKPWGGAKGGGESAEGDGKAAKEGELPLPVEDQTIALPDLQVLQNDRAPSANQQKQPMCI